MLQGLVTMLKGKDRDAEEEMEIKQRREGASERAEHVCHCREEKHYALYVFLSEIRSH